MKNIIFFVGFTNSPIGGVKVIYRHSSILNRLGSSEIYHHLGYTSDINWFNHDAKIKSDTVLSPENDFVILPESQIFHYWKELKELGIPYAIYVQNGYLTAMNINDDELIDAYDSSKFILCISQDTQKVIQCFSPKFSKKIIRLTYSINTDLFKPGIKEKTITYMPRKLKGHSDITISILKKRIPSDWSIIAIDNMSEQDVANTLSRSSIFLAFSDMEGLPVPPVEAAFCGNYVIGYTGQGGKEYWNPPEFTEISQGDIVDFVEKTLSRIQQIEKLDQFIPIQINPFLSSSFSSEMEIQLLKNLVNRINNSHE